MRKITPADELRNAILLMETEQDIKEQLLREQFRLTYESLKPINLIKSTIHDIASSPYLLDNILGAVVGLASGYISKKAVVGSSNSVFRKLLGTVLQFGVTNLVAHNPDTIKKVSRNIFQLLFQKKEANTEE